MPTTLDRMRDDPLLLAADTPTAVLDTGYVFRAVSPAHREATGVDPDDLLAADLFETFPANPDEPGCDGPSRLRGSFERVLATGRPHQLALQRYDIPDTAVPGTFLERYWVIDNSPVFDGSDPVGVLLRAHDVTSIDERLRRLLEGSGRAAPTVPDTTDAPMGPSASGDATSELTASDVRALVGALEDHRRLSAEAEHLRRALASRPTIEQAKGIVMAERGCSAEEAFEVLVDLSQRANVKLRDVASALVSRAAGRLAPSAA